MEDDNDTGTPPPTEPAHHESARESTPEGPQHDVTARIDGLSAKVDQLSGMVEQLVQNGSPDSSPVHRPWTHYGSH